jgi:hypothetical protein
MTAEELALIKRIVSVEYHSIGSRWYCGLDGYHPASLVIEEGIHAPGYHPPTDQMMFFFQDNDLEAFLRKDKKEKNNMSRAGWFNFEAELIHEMLHEYRCKRVSEPTQEGILLCKFFEKCFWGPGHDAEWFTALAEKAPEFGLSLKHMLIEVGALPGVVELKYPDFEASRRAMPRKVRTLLLALVALFLVATLTVLFLFVGRTPPPPPLPNPNGYDDFLNAAALLTGDVGNASTLDHDSLRALVSTNSEPLRLLRLGLTRGCSVPTDSAMTNISGLLGDLANLKSLARLLEEEGRLAQMENRYGDAAHSYVDGIRFGNEMSRGAFIINRLVGVACEAIGCGPLATLVPKLKADEARSVITGLEKIDAGRVSWAEVRRNENRFFRYQLSKGFNPIMWVMTRWQGRRSIQQAERKHNKVVAHERLLAVELALRCYDSEQGRVPTSLEQLVPQYLLRVPLDPFSGRPVVYHPQGTNWLVYSVGEDGVDNGGKRMGRSVSGTATKGDLFYDSPY